jgi:hypothetical protein
MMRLPTAGIPAKTDERDLHSGSSPTFHRGRAPTDSHKRSPTGPQGQRSNKISNTLRTQRSQLTMTIPAERRYAGFDQPAARLYLQITGIITPSC